MSVQRRKSRRLEVHYDLKWTIEDQQVSGEGTLLDVTVKGACLRITQHFFVSERLKFLITVPGLSVLPKRARLRWFRRLPGRPPAFLCGVIFDESSVAWERWLDAAVAARTSETAPTTVPTPSATT